MANEKRKANNAVPSELEGVAKTEDINALDDKVAKCYSSERYPEFQEVVRKIIIEVIGSDEGRKKIKAHAKEAAKEYKEENGWSKIQFWLPTIISVLVLIVAVFAIYHKP